MSATQEALVEVIVIIVLLYLIQWVIRSEKLQATSDYKDAWSEMFGIWVFDKNELDIGCIQYVRDVIKCKLYVKKKSGQQECNMQTDMPRERGNKIT